MKKKPSIEVMQQYWVHSHEEDTETEMIFRPKDFKFPRSRGRKSFDLRSDGSMVETRVGPDDRPLENQGTWKLEDADNLAFYFNSKTVPKVVAQIVSVDKDRLVIKKK